MEPIDGIRFIHAAIANQAQAFENEVRDVSTPEQAGELHDRFEFYALIVDRHMRGEEAGLFPPLIDKIPSFADTYLLDHEGERALTVELIALAERCQAGEQEALERLRRQTVALNEHAQAHVRKENEFVLPMCRELFSREEQEAMVANMATGFSPEVQARVSIWIVSNVDADVGADFLQELSLAMPPEFFERAKEVIHGALGDERWAELIRRAPALP